MADHPFEFTMIVCHGWWPGGGDPFYNANIQENRDRIEYYGVTGVPHVRVDGIGNGGSNGPWEQMGLDRYAVDSPLTIELGGAMSGDTVGVITAEILNTSASAVTGTLHFVLIEDDLTYSSRPYSHVMRDFFPGGTEGEIITFLPGVPVSRAVPCTLRTTWVRENMEVIAFVQDDGTTEVYQAGRIFFELDEPELVVHGSIVDDAAGGDGSGNLDPGESATLIYGLGNLNPPTASGVSGTLSSDDAYLTISDGSGTWPVIPYWTTQQNDLDPFAVSVDAATPWGYEIDVTLSVTALGRAYAKSFALILPVGSPHHPIGPDDYGYYAYEDLDPYIPSPAYDWVEIDPNLGGSGTEVTLGDDQSIRKDLPFTFRYYGEAWDRVSICSNGWIALGETYENSPSNGEIPGSAGPPRMVAAFWTDLDPTAAGGGKVYDYYDVAEGRYVVEFSGVEHYHSGDLGVPETFEFILLDPSIYPSATGDGEIVLQYADISDASGCVVGIEDATETIGIQYLGNGHLNAAAHGLEAGRAIKFTTTDTTGLVAVGDGATPVPGAAMLALRSNPFRSRMEIDYVVPADGEVALRVFNLEGALVRTLLRHRVEAGPGSIGWDGKDDRGFDVPAGVYFCRLTGSGFENSRKIVRVK